MPSFNITISNSSPIVQYSGPWTDTPKTDSDWTNYLNDTYHVTSVDGASATLQFNGSAVYIFGARKPGYGNYSVILDSGTPFQADPPTSSAKEFGVLLYHAASLDATREHQVTLRNVAGSSQESLDVDYMIITAGDGYAETTSNSLTWNENNPNIAYSAGWSGITGSNYTDGSAQLTYTQSAFATVSFTGNAIALYGTVNNDHGMFSVSIDGGPQSDFNGAAPEPRFGTMLYYTNGLPGGQHTLKLTNVSPAGNGQLINGLELDQVVVSSWPNPPSPPQSSGASMSPSSGTLTPPSSGTAAPAQETHTSGLRISTGAVVGVVIAAIATIVLVSLGLFLLLRSRRRRGNMAEKTNALPGDLHFDPFIAPPGRDFSRNDFSNNSPTLVHPLSASTIPPDHSFKPMYTDAISEGYTKAAMQLTGPASESSAAGSGSTGLTSPRGAATPNDRFGHASQLSVPWAIHNENPHLDFPPPEYEQVFPSSEPV